MACFDTSSLRCAWRVALPALLLAASTLATAQTPAPTEAPIAAPAPAAPAALRTGEQVYRTVCMACHATGVDKAPILGDRKAWAPLIREGQHELTGHAWVGIRKMPPRGGASDLSLEEFGSAVAYMARAAGGTWTDPDAAMLERIRKVEAKRLKKQQAGKS